MSYDADLHRSNRRTSTDVSPEIVARYNRAIAGAADDDTKRITRKHVSIGVSCSTNDGAVSKSPNTCNQIRFSGTRIAAIRIELPDPVSSDGDIVCASDNFDRLVFQPCIANVTNDQSAHFAVVSGRGKFQSVKCTPVSVNHNRQEIPFDPAFLSRAVDGDLIGDRIES